MGRPEAQIVRSHTAATLPNWSIWETTSWAGSLTGQVLITLGEMAMF